MIDIGNGNRTGEYVASGVYAFTMEGGDFAGTKKMAKSAPSWALSPLQTDSFLQYLLAMGLSENESLQQIILVNPAEAAQQRYKESMASHFARRTFVPITQKLEDWLPEWTGS